ncbi:MULTISPECIES: cold-shock protein [unclassified Mycobacterium]|uniref:cold-shock protein n=1 Tax=unclassified Mycobacterium TaxID=2642494 RepID=UPI0029C956D0|nr:MULTISPECIES: cold shock domain-containing protein [unclassified Mycobacterium]
MAIGTVKFYKSEKGWGAISSPDLPDGLDAFIHVCDIKGHGQPGYRALAAGDQVEFEFRPAHQDSFKFVATWAQRIDSA